MKKKRKKKKGGPKLTTSRTPCDGQVRCADSNNRLNELIFFIFLAQLGSFYVLAQLALLKFGSLLALVRCRPFLRFSLISSFKVWLFVSPSRYRPFLCFSPINSFEVWLFVNHGPLLNFGLSSAPFEVWIIVSPSPLSAPFGIWLVVDPFESAFTITCCYPWPPASLYLFR